MFFLSILPAVADVSWSIEFRHDLNTANSGILNLDEEKSCIIGERLLLVTFKTSFMVTLIFMVTKKSFGLKLETICKS